MSSGQVLPTVSTYIALAGSVNMLRRLDFNNTNEVVISNGGYYDSFYGTQKTNNGNVIPVAIYGVKYYSR